jgi:hypothetical protein
MAAIKNFSYSTVAVAPAPAASGTSLTVSAGHGALFAIGRPATIYPTGVPPLSTNAEIVAVTNVVGDVLTITRTQESTSARTVVVGDQIAQCYTAATANADEAEVDGKEPAQTVASQAEAQAGTEAALRSFSPLRIAQAIAALATGGGASRQTATNNAGDTTLTAIAASKIQHTAVVTFGGVARTSNIALPVANRVAGDRAVVKCLLPATASIVVVIKNDTTGGTTIFTITTDLSGDDCTFEVEYSGTEWLALRYNYPANTP